MQMSLKEKQTRGCKLLFSFYDDLDRILRGEYNSLSQVGCCWSLFLPTFDQGNSTRFLEWGWQLIKDSQMLTKTLLVHWIFKRILKNRFAAYLHDCVAALNC